MLEEDLEGDLDRKLNFDQRQKRQHQQQMRQLQRTRLELEGNRKVLGRGKIFTAMKDKIDNGEQKMMSRQELTTLLASSGLKPEQVLGVKFNEFRRGQVEFYFVFPFSMHFKLLWPKI